MYVNGVDKIIGTPFNTMHPNTPQSLNNEHKAEFSPSFQKMYKLHKCRIYSRAAVLD